LNGSEVDEALAVEPAGPGVLIIRLNRPERLNAINHLMVEEIEATCGRLANDGEIRVVVLTGAGRGFCSGLDIRDFGTDIPDLDASAADRLRFQERMAALPLKIRALPQAVIAAVNGPCVGGGMALCLAADIRIGSTSASFGNAAILLGLSGGEMGMSYHLPRIVGTSVAADWMISGRTVSAQEANQRGLLSQLVQPETLLECAIELANQIAKHSPLAVQLTKRALQVNADAADLSSAMELENRNQVLAVATEESAARRAQWSQSSRSEPGFSG
jgi:enoyl-CoA hydratase/carnithine racemase